MNEQNILNIVNRWEFRAWLEAHASVEAECWVAVKRGRPSAPEVFYYLDAVEEALCFGWVDSVQKLIDGKRMQRFSPRKSNSPWTELNKARVRRLENLGRMTDAERGAARDGTAQLPRGQGNRSRHEGSARVVEVQVVPGAVPAGAGV